MSQTTHKTELDTLAAALAACEAVPTGSDDDWESPEAEAARDLTGPKGLDWCWDFAGWEHTASQIQRRIDDIRSGAPERGGPWTK